MPVTWACQKNMLVLLEMDGYGKLKHGKSNSGPLQELQVKQLSVQSPQWNFAHEQSKDAYNQHSEDKSSLSYESLK